MMFRMMIGKRRLLWFGTLVVAVVLGGPPPAEGSPTNGWRRVQFREPQPTAYWVPQAAPTPKLTGTPAVGVTAWRVGSRNGPVLVGNRLALQLVPGTDLTRLLQGRPVTVERQITKELVILAAASGAAAIDQAEALARQAGVVASFPIMRRAARLMGRYAPQPNDPYFPQQWHLENRDTNGMRLGVDLDARSAWSVSTGAGILVAVADDGFELDHPDLSLQAANQPHYNFDTSQADGSPETSDAIHGTAVAGLVAATGNNKIGVSGVAPGAALASWVIFGSSGFGQETIVGNDALMNMFQYASNRVDVQNHSWADTSGALSGIDSLSDYGISNAITLGRGGLGIVMVRAGGNDRDSLYDANNDGFTGDPRAIAVAAVRADGKTCSYSSPGACLLVAAPSGDPRADGSQDPTAPNITTTDRQGALGYNTAGPGDSANYCFGDTGFDGTSASSPQVAGVAALILGANTNLTYRDVQQILLQSARPWDFTDPDLRTNGAGFLVSHNLGYGVPDAGLAVALARHWVSRPAAKRVSVESTATVNIPTNALQVVCTGPGLSPSLTTLACYPDVGMQADHPTPALPLVYVGQANADLTLDLHGKAALIQRGVSYFSDKINRAAKAGAAFAVVFDNTNNTELVVMAGTSFAPIPAVFISQNDGEALRNYVEGQPANTAQIRLQPATVTFNVTDTVICEHVGLHIKTTTTSRSDLRITLVSPAGTRSVLQTINNDTSPDPADWTYWSVQHFYESSAGQWRLEVSNEQSSALDTINYAQLLIDGVPITDTDHDGLDDNWELKWFGTLVHGPADDLMGDGYTLARKQCLGTDPTKFTPFFGPDLSFWNSQSVRVSFPAAPNRTFQILSAPDAGQPFSVLTNLLGHLPEVDLVVPYRPNSNQFFRAQVVSATNAPAR